jgi:DNA-binding response OmpR family regulator
MDVLIIERDDMIATVLVDSLAEDGVAAAILHDDNEALALSQQSAPRVVITGMNRHGEDMRGLALGRALRARFPLLVTSASSPNQFACRSWSKQCASCLPEL